MLELEPPRLGPEKIDPELPELLEPLELLELLEPLSLELAPLLELLEPELLPDVPLLVVVLAVEEDACVKPHMPRKTPIVAAAAPTRSVFRAERRAAGDRRVVPAAARAGAICLPAVARVMSLRGWATQLST